MSNQNNNEIIFADVDIKQIQEAKFSPEWSNITHMFRKDVEKYKVDNPDCDFIHNHDKNVVIHILDGYAPITNDKFDFVGSPYLRNIVDTSIEKLNAFTYSCFENKDQRPCSNDCLMFKIQILYIRHQVKVAVADNNVEFETLVTKALEILKGKPA